MLEIIIILFALIVPLLAVRLTANPFRLGYNVIEGGANTYTEAVLEVPLSITGTKIQGIELMKWHNISNASDVEADQENETVTQLVKDSQTGQIRYDNSDLIHQFVFFNEENFTTSGAEILNEYMDRSVDLTDGDGNGQLLAERRIHVGILGVGNGSAKRATGYVLCHLVEFSPEEFLVQVVADDL